MHGSQLPVQHYFAIVNIVIITSQSSSSITNRVQEHHRMITRSSPKPSSSLIHIKCSIEISFGFVNNGAIMVDENTTFSEVCIEVLSGRLGTDVTFTLNTTNDSDPRTLNGI